MVDQCHKILGPPLKWGPILLILWGPHRDFGAPFELALLARLEIAFDTAIYPMQSCQTFSGFSVGFCINEEEGSLLPTIARKITCRRFD